MNVASYNAVSDALGYMGEMSQRRKMEKILRQEAEERRAEGSADRAAVAADRDASRDIRERSLQAEMRRWQTERDDRLKKEMEEADPLTPYRRIQTSRAGLMKEAMAAAPERQAEINGQMAYLKDLEAGYRRGPQELPGARRERDEAERRRKEEEAADPLAKVSRIRGRRAGLEQELASATPERRGQIEADRAFLTQMEQSLLNPAAGPMAKVTRKAGDASASYEVPVPDIEKALGGASGYKSPYAEDIAGFDRQIVEQQAEMAGGDTRTGFLGIGTSRQGVINKAKNQRLQMKALELQDMLEKGIIDQREADRRAAILMKQ